MKKVYLFVQIIFVIVANVGCTYYTGNKGQIENLPKLHREHIEKISVGKIGFEKNGDSTIRTLEIYPTKEQIDKIITWYNSIPSERLILLTNHQTGSIKLGIVFKLDKNKEIRIQYTSKGEIFVTTFPPFQIYKVDDSEIAKLFNDLMI